MRGKFIVFEGIDGSGKSSQVGMLKNKLLQDNRKVYTTFEPSNGPIGVLIRQGLQKRISFDELTMAALFASDRLDHINNKINGIKQKLDEGYDVICDRYYLSNFAYQSVGVNLAWVEELNGEAMRILKPDVHLFIDVPIEVALKRISANRVDVELYESKERLKHTRDVYLSVIDKYQASENIVLIDGNKAIQEVGEDIYKVVVKLTES